MIAFAYTRVSCVLFKYIKFRAGIEQVSRVSVITEINTATVYTFLLIPTGQELVARMDGDRILLSLVASFRLSFIMG
jgi:hypothetical protein